MCSETVPRALVLQPDRSRCLAAVTCSKTTFLLCLIPFMGWAHGKLCFHGQFESTRAWWDHRPDCSGLLSSWTVSHTKEGGAGRHRRDRRGSRTGMLTFEQVWYLHHLFRSSHIGNEETARWAGTFLGEGPLFSFARGILRPCRPMGKP